MDHRIGVIAVGPAARQRSKAITVRIDTVHTIAILVLAVADHVRYARAVGRVIIIAILAPVEIPVIAVAIGVVVASLTAVLIHSVVPDLSGTWVDQCIVIVAVITAHLLALVPIGIGIREV
jgi:hypothetical protein